MATNITAGSPGAHGKPAGGPGARGKQAGAVRPSGLCYGRRASNLPKNDKILQFYRDQGFSKMLLTPTAKDAIPLLQDIKDNGGVPEIVLCIEYTDLPGLANIENAGIWYGDYVQDYQSFISHICVGNVVGSEDFAVPDFKKAIFNIRALIPNTIKLATMVNYSMLEGTYQGDTPPSTCRLKPLYVELFRELSEVNGPPSPLFVRIMPYFMIGEHVLVENCLLNTDAQTYMWDDGKAYCQVFDAMLDSICMAHGNVDRSRNVVDVNVVTGWPTAGSKPEATLENAETYLRNLQSRADSHTPGYNKPAQIYIYSLVNEDKYDKVIKEFKHLGIPTFNPNQPQETATAINN